MDARHEIDLQLAVFVTDLSNKYQFTPEDIAKLIDTFKTFMGEYHRLVEEGKIPKDRQLVHNKSKAMDAINGFLANFGKEM